MVTRSYGWKQVRLNGNTNVNTDEHGNSYLDTDGYELNRIRISSFQNGVGNYPDCFIACLAFQSVSICVHQCLRSFF